MEDGGESDTTATADSDLDQALVNTRRYSGSLAPRPASQGAGVGAPYNPFARTLATSEAPFGLQRDSGRQQGLESSNADEQPQSQNGKTPLDVDSFKNLLMTGSAVPSSSFLSPTPRMQESSSGTSSMSKHSLFDPAFEYNRASPLSRTPFEQDERRSSEYESEEGSNLMNNSERLDDFAPPAPPKHNLGKPPGARGPQTVSFADFDEAIPPGYRSSQGHMVSSDRDGGTLGPPTLHRSPSDLNKPLPPPPTSPPRVQKGPEDVSQPDESSNIQQQIPTPPTTDLAPEQKKAPPPPPASRRGGQSSAGNGRSRSTSDVTQDSTHDSEPPHQITPTETPGKAAAPPPPPSRKAKPLSASSTPAAVTPPEGPSPAPAEAEMRNIPPPPPRRNPSKTGNTLQRSPSSTSQSSVSHGVTTAPSSKNNAPPAPPPRRGAGPRSESSGGASSAMAWAVNSRRGSGTSFGSERSTSASNLHQVNETAGTEESLTTTNDSVPSRDILADMSAFQAEIDALRGQARKNG